MGGQPISIVNFSLVPVRRFNVHLDSRKSGHVVKPLVYADDQNRYKRQLPTYMSDTTSVDPIADARRDGELGLFVLQALASTAKRAQEEFMRRRESIMAAKPYIKDAVIEAQWNTVAECDWFRDEILVVQDFVGTLYIDYLRIWTPGPGTPVASSKAEKKAETAFRTAQLRTLCTKFCQGPPSARTPRLRQLKMLDKAMAAWAYLKSPKFGFSVAFTQLAAIKANACGLAPLTEVFDSVMTMPSSAARLLAQQAEP